MVTAIEFDKNRRQPPNANGATPSKSARPESPPAGTDQPAKPRAESPAAGTPGGADAQTAGAEDAAVLDTNNRQNFKGHETLDANPTNGDGSSPDAPLSRSQARQMVQMLKLFADETRLCILSRLMLGESNVQSLCKHLGQTQPAVSHHLAMLKEAGMIAMRRSGKHNYYRLDASPTDGLLLALRPLMQ